MTSPSCVVVEEMRVQFMRQQSLKMIRLPCIGVRAFPTPPPTTPAPLPPHRGVSKSPGSDVSPMFGLRVSSRVRLGGACGARWACRRGYSTRFLVVW